MIGTSRASGGSHGDISMATAEAQQKQQLAAVPLPDIDEGRHLSLEALEHGFLARSEPPRDSGIVSLIVARPESCSRGTWDCALLTASGGIPGDRWSRASSPDPNMQLAVMETSVADLIANGQPRLLFGDNLFVDLDLSAENLPTGSRLRAGRAVLEVTPEPHSGCRHFRARFGADALRFVAAKDTRSRKLRGIYMKVIEDGELRVGDRIEVLRRGA
jgi:hypothetical protein